MIFACRPDNDLYRVVAHLEASLPRYENAAEAVEKAPPGSDVVESGWTNTWIAVVLAMRRLGTSLFQLATARPLQVPVSSLLQEMLVV